MMHNPENPINDETQKKYLKECQYMADKSTKISEMQRRHKNFFKSLSPSLYKKMTVYNILGDVLLDKTNSEYKKSVNDQAISCATQSYVIVVDSFLNEDQSSEDTENDFSKKQFLHAIHRIAENANKDFLIKGLEDIEPLEFLQKLHNIIDSVYKDNKALVFNVAKLGSKELQKEDLTKNTLEKSVSTFIGKIIKRKYSETTVSINTLLEKIYEDNILSLPHDLVPDHVKQTLSKNKDAVVDFLYKKWDLIKPSEEDKKTKFLSLIKTIKANDPNRSPSLLRYLHEKPRNFSFLGACFFNKPDENKENTAAGKMKRLYDQVLLSPLHCSKVPADYQSQDNKVSCFIGNNML